MKRKETDELKTRKERKKTSCIRNGRTSQGCGPFSSPPNPPFSNLAAPGGSAELVASTARRSCVSVRRTRYHRAPSLSSGSSQQAVHCSRTLLREGNGTCSYISISTQANNRHPTVWERGIERIGSKSVVMFIGRSTVFLSK